MPSRAGWFEVPALAEPAGLGMVGAVQVTPPSVVTSRPLLASMV